MVHTADQYTKLQLTLSGIGIGSDRHAVDHTFESWFALLPQLRINHRRKSVQVTRGCERPEFISLQDSAEPK